MLKETKGGGTKSAICCLEYIRFPLMGEITAELNSVFETSFRRDMDEATSLDR